METKPFVDEFDLLFDSKNRLSIPVAVRDLIKPEIHGNDFYVTIRDQVAWLYCEKTYERLIRQLRPKLAPGEELVALQQLKFGLVTRIPPDSQGRLQFKDKFLKRAALDKEVTLVGMQDHLELWQRDRWSKRCDYLLSQSVRIEQEAAKILSEQQRDRVRNHLQPPES